jgi:uncharacterized protein (UPF0548 family)
MPLDYKHLHLQRVIGRGRDDFDRLAERAMRWEVQRGAGLAVRSTAERATDGASVTVQLKLGPVTLDAPCVVVYTVDEPRCRGFAYGTLAGHPEQGEALFLVEHLGDEAVTLTVRAFSRPALWWTKAGRPATRLVQRIITRRYLRALDS